MCHSFVICKKQYFLQLHFYIISVEQFHQWLWYASWDHSIIKNRLVRSGEYYTCVCRVLCQSFIQHTTLHVVNDNYTDNNQENVDQSKDPKHYTT